MSVLRQLSNYELERENNIFPMSLQSHSTSHPNSPPPTSSLQLRRSRRNSKAVSDDDDFTNDGDVSDEDSNIVPLPSSDSTSQRDGVSRVRHSGRLSRENKSITRARVLKTTVAKDTITKANSAASGTQNKGGFGSVERITQWIRSERVGGGVVRKSINYVTARCWTKTSFSLTSPPALIQCPQHCLLQILLQTH